MKTGITILLNCKYAWGGYRISLSGDIIHSQPLCKRHLLDCNSWPLKTQPLHIYIPLFPGPFNYLDLPKSDYYNQITLIICFYYRWEASFMFTQIKISVLVRLRIIGWIQIAWGTFNNSHFSSASYDWQCRKGNFGSL